MTFILLLTLKDKSLENYLQKKRKINKKIHGFILTLNKAFIVFLNMKQPFEKYCNCTEKKKKIKTLSVLSMLYILKNELNYYEKRKQNRVIF